jgi:leukotriene-A4 hydrolase
VFEPFLPAYIERFKYKSITTDHWKSFLYEFFSDKKSILDEMDWKTWFHSPGMPPIKPTYDTSLAEAVWRAADLWAGASDDQLDQLTAENSCTQGFSTHQIIEFLAKLLEQKPLSHGQIERLQAVHNYNAVQNAEIRLAWLRLCLRAHVKGAVSLALQFVNEQGRLKFLRPIYRDLFRWEAAKEDAITNFRAHKHEMHPLAVSMLAKDMDLTEH